MKMEKMNGYITTTGKYHYILLTEKRKLTMPMLVSFLHTIAEKQNIPQNKVNDIINNRQALMEMRKRISPCLYDDTGDIIRINFAKCELHYPKCDTENPIVTFNEQEKENPAVMEFLKEA